FRNDADVATLNSHHWNFGLEKPSRPESFFTTVIFENSAEVSLDPGDFWSELAKLEQDRHVERDFREVSMSWYLARAEMAASAAAILGEPPEYGLRLMSWGEGTGIPTSGNKLVIVGTDNNNLLHYRIFHQGGNLVTDIDESKIAHPTPQARAILTLKQQ